MAERIMKYNPAYLPEDVLVRNFVVRRGDLALLANVVEDNSTAAANQHLLVLGPRGSGKTTLVLRLAAEIRRSETLGGRWYPVVFPEESYEVASAGELWLEALSNVADQTGEERWRKVHDELKSERDDDRLRERALGQLLDFADSQGKRLLLVIENIHMLLGQQISNDEAWKIRHTLQNEPRLMLLATATDRFDSVENSSLAMYEMFITHHLPPLNDDESNEIWRLVAGRPLAGQRIRPIRILTGGNLRLLTIIAKFGAGRSFERLLDDLVSLIDDHTEYFKSHLDNLAPTERKVYLALAELWDFSGARAIAEAARLDVNKTSSLLNRLAGKGAVLVESGGKRAKLYAVAERMYNIYYLMRKRGAPSDRVRAAVKFMVGMYGPESAASGEERFGADISLRSGASTSYFSNPGEALDSAKLYLADDKAVAESIPDAIELVVELAAGGYAKEALALLAGAPAAAKHLEPLVAALRLYGGEKVNAAVEIADIARDLIKRIEERAAGRRRTSVSADGSGTKKVMENKNRKPLTERGKNII